LKTLFWALTPSGEAPVGKDQSERDGTAPCIYRRNVSVNRRLKRPKNRNRTKEQNATFAENLQLEYLEGMPDSQVGWGGVDKQSMTSLMALHAASSDLVQRTPVIARAQAGNLLSQILGTLDQAEEHKPISTAIGTPEDKVVFLVGHDTNISNLAALLDAHWLVNGYQRDDAAPEAPSSSSFGKDREDRMRCASITSSRRSNR
jgi:hypothetical protein